MSNEKDCFVIAPIGEPESDTRKRSDQVLKHMGVGLKMSDSAVSEVT